MARRGKKTLAGRKQGIATGGKKRSKGTKKAVKHVSGKRSNVEKRKGRPKRMGRPPIYTERKKKQVLTCLAKLQSTVGRYREVTAQMVLDSYKGDLEMPSLRGILREGTNTKRLQTKQPLKPGEKTARVNWCKKKVRKSQETLKRSYWLDHHALVKLNTLRGRNEHNRQNIGHWYEIKDESLRVPPPTKRGAKMKYNFGGLFKTALLVGGPKRRLCLIQHQKSWDEKERGDGTALMEDIFKAIKKDSGADYKDASLFLDNDRVWGKPAKAVARKYGMSQCLQWLPKYSPDLNALDWSVNKTFDNVVKTHWEGRDQERVGKKAYVEQSYAAAKKNRRLRDNIRNCGEGFKKRLQECIAANGDAI